MMPLWISATPWRSSVWGWALFSVTAPCVAQRVWAMPSVPSKPLAPANWFSRTLTRPTVLVSRISPLSTAMPAESYPRYSNRLRPSIRMGAASRCPIYATIPHMRRLPWVSSNPAAASAGPPSDPGGTPDRPHMIGHSPDGRQPSPRPAEPPRTAG